MAQIAYRVTGRSNGRRQSRTFRSTDEGRESAKAFAGTLEDPATVYDVRTRIGGRVVTRTFRRRRDADAYATTTEADRLTGTALDPRRARTTVKHYAEEWLAGRRDLAATTTALYQHLLTRHIEPAFGDVELGALSPSRVRSWNAQLASAHPTTAAKAYRLLATVMRAAVADRLLAQNPCQVKGAATERAAERPVATVAEVEALASAMPDHLRLAVLLAAWCQLRRGEILGLRRQDVDAMHGTLSVTMTRTVTIDGKVIEKPPKTEAGHRTVAVPANIRAELERHMATVDVAADARAFDDEQARELRAAWAKARRAIGRPELHLHDLRHSGLTWSAATGATLAELMHRAGHRSPTAALRYQHATRDRDRALADALAALATPATVSEIHIAR